VETRWRTGWRPSAQPCPSSRSASAGQRVIREGVVPAIAELGRSPVSDATAVASPQCGLTASDHAPTPSATGAARPRGPRPAGAGNAHIAGTPAPLGGFPDGPSFPVAAVVHSTSIRPGQIRRLPRSSPRSYGRVSPLMSTGRRLLADPSERDNHLPRRLASKLRVPAIGTLRERSQLWLMETPGSADVGDRRSPEWHDAGARIGSFVSGGNVCPIARERRSAGLDVAAGQTDDGRGGLAPARTRPL
jgi:hypothetical protein